MGGSDGVESTVWSFVTKGMDSVSEGRVIIVGRW